MRKRYTTESGSIYTIDFDKKTWKRKRGRKAQKIRSDSGTFDKFSVDEYGIVMLCPPFDPDTSPFPRGIFSTKIIKEEELV